ncbi:MAG TPA: TIM barrel protein, partial [Bacteroidaceae bacterium]|nr:TIM barrel protein [Bacteroidaceae bacterium]
SPEPLHSHNYDNVWQEFDEVVGMEWLRAIHLNDSKRELGSRVDRHDSIGKGYLGLDFFKRIMRDPALDNMPLIIETPDESLWAAEIELLHSFEEP